MANLLESYKNRLAISESVHQRSHNGAKMTSAKKLMIASVLNNTSKFMNEAFDSSAATQRSALGDYKKFCLNVSTVALPNLILPDLMLTQPMTSISGYVTYLRYTAGTTKGGVVADETMFGSVYRHGEMTPERVNYTSERVVEDIVTDEDGNIVFAWTPVAPDSVKVLVNNAYQALEAVEGKFVAPEGATKVAYVYDNVVIPQQSKPTSIPTLKAAMDAIDLHAHARRIAVYYSQIAAFQAKTDYGFDLADQLSTQAQGELAYEIDTEGVLMLYKGAEKDKELDFESYQVSNQNTYISRSQYYEYFTEIIAKAKKIMYQRTQKFAPNYMVCGANVLTIMPYVKGWNAAPASNVNGPYFAGTVEGLKVYCSPSIPENDFFFGVNGSDLQTSAAVYAPYMAIVPTQLLGFADGGMSQGFSTMYDMKLLSTYSGSWNKFDEAGNRTPDAVDDKEGTHSYLLVGGQFIV
jgi:hypothetical protein